jgi:hypothetical protein
MQIQFTGREKELNELNSLFSLKKAALVTCRGRRRIGKSTLIQVFGKQAGQFLEFQGLPPRENITIKDQLGAFSSQLARQTGFPELRLDSWEQAFSLLNRVITDKKTVVLLDEISWLAIGDKDFAGKLKIAWDTEFKSHHKLVLVLCGSVSSWLEKNILNSTGFVGRISYDLKLEELDLYSCNFFWGKNHHLISTDEKLKILTVTGGIPRYLEEIRPDISAEDNIQRLCFTKGGVLFSEFEHIFNSIFSRRATKYKKILYALVGGSRDLEEICTKVGIEKSGTISTYLDDLVEAGFIRKERSVNIASLKESRFAKYSLKDNYTRFYLKYIEGKRDMISTSMFKSTSLDTLIEWDVIRGFQFENLVINNIESLIDLLEINRNSIKYAAPYFQKKNKKQKACQIDLLIITKYSIFVCEIKFRKQIEASVIGEVSDKIAKLRVPPHLSAKPVLIYRGEISASVSSEDYFSNLIDVGDLLLKKRHYK